MKIICGIDEAGRGPLAGPVAASSVILPLSFPLEILNDSKKLTAKKREEAARVIKQKALYSVAFVDNETIDKINILNASLLAMQKSFEGLIKKFSDWVKVNNLNSNDWNIQNVFAVVDGLYVPKISVPSEARVKADTSCYEVMAASIIAKVERDKVMLEYDALYPEYEYAKHKGYGTSRHREICKKLGPSPIQRLSFNYK